MTPDDEELRAIIAKAFERLRLNVAVSTSNPDRLRQALTQIDRMEQAVHDDIEAMRRLLEPSSSKPAGPS